MPGEWNQAGEGRFSRTFYNRSPIVWRAGRGRQFFSGWGFPKSVWQCPCKRDYIEAGIRRRSIWKRKCTCPYKIYCSGQKIFRRPVSIGNVFRGRGGGANNGCFKFVIIYVRRFPFWTENNSGEQNCFSIVCSVTFKCGCSRLKSKTASLCRCSFGGLSRQRWKSEGLSEDRSDGKSISHGVLFLAFYSSRYFGKNCAWRYTGNSTEDRPWRKVY